MPLKFWEGSVPNTRAAWSCPSCGAPNTGALPDGCVACGAGKDGGKVATPFARTLAHTETVDEAHAAFLEWASTLKDLASQPLREHGEAAFKAGAAWQRQHQIQPTAGPLTALAPLVGGTAAAPPLGGFMLALVHPETHDTQVPDPRAHQTILAALAFYRDNQLGYGPLPGQLSAAEVTSLITQLSPQEEPPV